MLKLSETVPGYEISFFKDAMFPEEGIQIQPSAQIISFVRLLPSLLHQIVINKFHIRLAVINAVGIVFIPFKFFL